MTFVYLVLAIVAEVIATSALKAPWASRARYPAWWW